MSPYVQLLYQALDTPYGIIVEHEDPPCARSQFYAARKAHKDPALQRISVTILEGQPTRLYLVKCPDEKKNLSSAHMSGSIAPMPNGSGLPTPGKSESPEQSDP